MENETEVTWTDPRGAYSGNSYFTMTSSGSGKVVGFSQGGFFSSDKVLLLDPDSSFRSVPLSWCKPVIKEKNK